MTPSEKIPQPVRAWIYRILVAVLPLLVLLGVLAEDVAQHVLFIAAAVLGTGEAVLAAAHTPRKRDEPSR